MSSTDKQQPDKDYAVNKLVDLNDFIDTRLPARYGYWGNSFVSRGFVTFIAAREKRGKTLFTLDLCLHMAVGKEFLGIPTRKPKKIIYLQSEISQDAFQERIRQMTKGDMRPPRGSFEYAMILGLTFHHTEVRDLIANSGADVVVFDPFYRFHKLDENRTQDMSRIADVLTEFKLRYNTAIIVVHHHGKEDAETKRTGSQQLRGSSVLAGYHDSYMALTGSTKGKFMLSFECRHEADIEPLPVERVDGFRHIVKGPGGKKVGTCAELAAMVVELGMPSQIELARRFGLRHNCSEDTAIRRIAEATHFHFMEKVEKQGSNQVYFTVPNEG